jgi:formamidopyrimidine-DNA glycosylase
MGRTTSPRRSAPPRRPSRKHDPHDAELPDVEVYREASRRAVIGQPRPRVHVRNPFVLRTAVPPLDVVIGQTVRDVLRVGKRIVLAFDGELFLVLHLMIAGRLQWLPAGRKPPGKITLALFAFPTGTLAFTEAGTRRRASLHLAQGAAALAAFDAGRLDVLGADEPAFRDAGARETIR